MSFRISKNILGVMVGALLFEGASVALADIEQDRAEGIAWLLENQNGDGSWGKDGAKVAATAEALAALRNSGADAGFLYSRAISWLANARTDSIDSLARKITALEAAGFDTIELGLADELMNQRNAQKGWGAFNGHSSGFPDTALALIAVKESGIAYPDLNTSLGLIRSGQTAGDSGWSYIAGSQGTGLTQQIMPSAYNLMTLSAYQPQSSSSTYITRGVNWLINSTQQASGSFLEDGTITTGADHKTALGYLAIKAASDAGITPTGSATALTSAQSYILGQQSADGGWGGDAFTTALALRTFPATAMTDTDGDGIPDTVESLLGTNPTVADGRELLDENGLDPDNLQNSGMSSPAIIQEILKDQWFTYTPVLSGGAAPFTWQVAGEVPAGVTLQSTSDGTLSGTAAVSGSYIFSMHVQEAGGNALIIAGHIRVLDSNDYVTDTDQDGAPSAFEILKGYDPVDANSTAATDTDGDGVKDWFDLFPNNPLDWADADGDGIGNNADPDDDNDGMPDSYETRYGLNPNNGSDAAVDSDGDGLTNLQESQYNTNPFTLDTDGDGIDDATEIAQGSNPNMDDDLVPVIITIINSLLLS